MSVLTNWVLKRTSVLLLVTFALLGFGVFAITQIKSELFPNINFPVISISTVYPGASPEDVAEQVSKPIEAAVGSLPRITSLKSTSADSISILVLQFDYGTDLKDTEATINQNLRSVTLPTGPNGSVIQPSVARVDFGASPIITASLIGNANQNSADLEKVAREQIVPALTSLDGVASVNVVGGATNQVSVAFDLAKLRDKGLTISGVQQILNANNITLPAGSIIQNGQNVPIRTTGALTTLDQIANLIVGVKGQAAGTGAGGFGGGAQGAAPGGQTGGAAPTTGTATQTGGAPQIVKLSDVATVTYGPATASSISRTDRKPSVTIQVLKTQAGNTVKASELVRNKLNDIKGTLGGSYDVKVIYDQSVQINESIDGLVREGALGAVFAIIIIFLFLRNIRSTLVTAVSIPTSVLVALLLMWWQGISLNVITLSAFAIAVGRVVDDAIVVLENIFRHVTMGEPVPVAVRRGTKEVASAITSSTIATVCVFLPLGFVGGVTSQFFLPFALTITFALIASLIVALTIIPVFAQWFISRKLSLKMAEAEHKDTFLQRIYTPILRWALGHRIITVVAALVLFVGSVGIVPLLPVAFLPSDESDKILAVATAFPPGTDSATVDANAQKLEEALTKYPKTQTISTTIGSGGGSFGQAQRALGATTNGASLQVRFSEDTDLKKTTDELKALLKPLTPQGGRISIGEVNNGSNSNTLTLILDGSNQDSVRKASDQVLAAIKDVGALQNLRSDISALTPQITITINPNAALPAGQTAIGIASTLRTYIQGQSVTQVRIDQSGGQPVNVQFSVPADTASDIEKIKALTFGTNPATGQPMTLGQIATVAQGQGPTQVTRISQKPAATITADITDQNTGGVTSDVQKRVKALTLPAGVEYYFGGTQQQQSNAFSGLFIAFGIAILLVYVTLVLIFGSLLDPFVILLSLPLASVGAFTALLVTGRAIGLPAMIGILMLIGIVVTNAIVLIDLVVQLRGQGHAKNEALLMAGRSRLRPILMTALATILALSPLALGFAKGSVIGAELATVVIGGLLTSTLLTLVVIPCIYSLLHGLSDRIAPNKGKHHDEVAEWEAMEAQNAANNRSDQPAIKPAYSPASADGHDDNAADLPAPALGGSVA